MPNTTTVVIGAGHCGLAMSRCLAERSVDHVVLERGEVAHSWRTQRWDSMRLLTPNWMNRLPGYAYRGDDADGYLTVAEVVRLIEDYSTESAAPLLTGTAVTAVRPGGPGYVVHTDQGIWRAPTVVVATGATSTPNVPGRLAAQVPTGIMTLSTADYRNPGQLPDGGVLVVGGSASGVQIAEEVQRSGRPVTLAVGEHVRMPRTYRGRDILWWMDASGLLDERYDEVPDLVRARGLPSMQLVGSPQRATVDLDALRRLGVRLVGRLAGIRDRTAQFSGSLTNVCALADLKLGRLLDTIDAWADRTEVGVEHPPQRFAPTEVPAPAALSAHLGAGEIATIIWATGYRHELPWLDVAVFDRKGRARHDGGVMPSPGLYLIGLPFLRRRKSTLIDGAAADAGELTTHLVGYLDTIARRPLVDLRAS
jgi:putative flavoprotein involved in K+ transport